jgi:putative phosphoesterase
MNAARGKVKERTNERDSTAASQGLDTSTVARRRKAHVGKAMKVGLISDIHCNLPALERAFDVLSDCDEVICAGDLIYQYRFSNSVLTLLRARGVRTIVGNHDNTVLHAPGHPLRQSATVDPDCFAYLADLPERLMLEFGDVRVAVFHGAPWDEPKATSACYLYPENARELARLGEVDADVIVLGHTHRPFTAEVGRTVVVNPGSCGEPRDTTRTYSCAVLDLPRRAVEFRPFTLTEG